jgi:hypothetical protein
MGKILYKGKVYALYGQVALLDSEASAYPDWETGTECAVSTPRAVAVATASDTEVEVTVCTGQWIGGKVHCISGEIDVGNHGLTVGNVVSSDLHRLAWPRGRAAVDVYVDQSERATQVWFVLDRSADVTTRV